MSSARAVWLTMKDVTGSSDGKTWVVLKRHTNDNSLSGPFAIHSWPIPAVNDSYRHFRSISLLAFLSSFCD